MAITTLKCTIGKRGKYFLLCAEFGVLQIKSFINLLVLAMLTQVSVSAKGILISSLLVKRELIRPQPF